jgi:hypothetical protein
MIMSLGGGDICTMFINSMPFRRQTLVKDQTMVLDSKDEETGREVGLAP